MLNSFLKVWFTFPLESTNVPTLVGIVTTNPWILSWECQNFSQENNFFFQTCPNVLALYTDINEFASILGDILAHLSNIKNFQKLSLHSFQFERLYKTLSMTHFRNYQIL